MKLVTTLLIFACLFFIPAPKENDLSIELLRGKVKSCTVATYSIVSRNGTESRRFLQRRRTEYNMSGFKTKVTTHYDEAGQIKSSWEGKYDDKGELISDSPDKWKTVEVAKDGSRTETIRSGSRFIEIKKYGTDKLLREKVMTDLDGKLITSATIAYNSKGYKSKEEDYGSNGKLSQTILYIYDDFDNVVEIQFYNAALQTSKITYTYAPNNGPMLERNLYNTMHGSPQLSKGEKFSKPDKHNNWLQSRETFSGDAVLKIREIEYYPD